MNRGRDRQRGKGIQGKGELGKQRRERVRETEKQRKIKWRGGRQEKGELGKGDGERGREGERSRNRR